MRSIAWKRCCWVVCLQLLFTVRVFWTHTTGVSYSDIEISERQIDVRLRLNLRDLQFARDLDQNGDLLLTREEVQNGLPRYLPQLLQQIRMESAGEKGQGRLKQSDFSPERGEVECRLEYSFQQPLDEVTMTIALHHLTDSGHWNLAQICYDRRQEQRSFNLENSQTHVILFRSLSSYFRLGRGYLRLALHRVVTRPDLLLFLAGLLLTGKSWRTFLVPAVSLLSAQSLTLVLGTWAGPMLPPKFVDSALALSVIYIAAENLFIREVGHRSWIAAFFGLIYGVSFSNLLQDAGLPERGRLTALWGYQAGIVLTVACTMVLLFVAVIWLDRIQRQRQAVALMSLCFMALGVFEFVQRTFH